MGLFDKLTEPVFLKETSSAQKQLEILKELLDKAKEHEKNQIRQEIKLIEYGLQGEKQIAFELKNSHMPMYILHDLYFEQDGLSAQIDYLVVTKKTTFVLECKNLFGDITINESGNFIRTMSLGGRTIREGIYSPVTQNRRHMEMIKAMCVNTKKNFLSKALFAKFFEDDYQSVVVLANPKTILKAQDAPEEIKNQVIRADQLIEYIKKINHAENKTVSSDQDMERRANFFLNKHIEKTPDYNSKYMGNRAQESKKEQSDTSDEELLIKELKAFRLEQSRKEKVKPYYIFSDQQMRALIEVQPSTIEELIQISGFGKVKCEKYGEMILRIIQKKSE